MKQQEVTTTNFQQKIAIGVVMKEKVATSKERKELKGKRKE